MRILSFYMFSFIFLRSLLESLLVGCLEMCFYVKLISIFIVYIVMIFFYDSCFDHLQVLNRTGLECEELDKFYVSDLTLSSESMSTPLINIQD